MTLYPGSFSGSSTASLPAILCLHGGGTNYTIFNVQLIRLQRALSKHFNFFFVDGPFETPAGPGVLPIFDDCGPYLRWVKFDEPGTPKETRTIIEHALKEKEFVGVLGFSQGAMLAAGLLLEQQSLAKSQTNGSSATGGFKFGVCLCGTSPPLTSNLSDGEKSQLIEIPTVHVVGLQDPWCNDSRKLFTSFDQKYSKKFEFDIGHHLPTVQAETDAIAAEVISLYEKTLGP